MPPPAVNWYEQDVRLALANATPAMLMAAASQIEGQAKVNVTTNGQVDTGFMLNSIYTVAKGGHNGYGAAQASATAQNPDADMAPPADPGEGAAVVAGADYAIYQEMRNSFLYRAAEQVAGQLDGAAIQAAAREHGL